MKYSFLDRTNRKAILTIIANYINLSQYELARSLLHHLVVKSLFTGDDLSRGSRRRRRKRRRKGQRTQTDISREEKVYYLKKALKFMRRFLSYGCCPLQVFSNEQSSAHFLLKVARDYNRFVDLILGNLLSCGVRKAHLVDQPSRSVPRQPRQLRSLLRKKYVPKQLQSKITFDALLATIVVHREYYLCAFEDSSFFSFSLDTVQCLRRVYYLQLKAGALLLGRGNRGRKRDCTRGEKRDCHHGQWRLLNLFNRIVPFSVPTRGPSHEKNTPPMGNSPNKRAKQSYRPKMRETDQLQKIDELVLHSCRVVYGEKVDQVKASFHAVSSNRESNEAGKKNKEGGTLSMHIIYIPPLHIINKAPIYNYLNTFEEEIHYFCQHNVVTSLYRELFCLMFFFPALAVQLLKTLCLNHSFFDFLLSLLFLSDRNQSSVSQYLQDGSDGTPALGAAREGGVSMHMRGSATEGKNPVKEDAPPETGMKTETETETETAAETETETEAETETNAGADADADAEGLPTPLYYGVVGIYIDALVEKLKRKDLVNYHNFLYLLKFNHIFVNNVFFFSLCFANVGRLTGVNGGDTHLRRNPHKNLHLAQKALHKVYDWLVLLVFHYNGDEDAVHHFGHCPEYPLGGEKREKGKKREKGEKREKGKKREKANKNGEDVTFYKVLLRGVVLHLPVNYSHIRAIFFFYVNKMREKKRDERTIPNANHKKSVIYDILMSTNTFRCSDEGLVVNVLLHLFNYADDLYCRWVHTCMLYSHVRSGGKEDLLFCLNGSRIRGVHFLSYLLDLCEVHLASQEFLYLDRLLQNFNGLKNLCVLFCLENAMDVHVKRKCLSEMKGSRSNVYLYNYIRDMKVRVRISFHHYQLHKQNRRVNYGLKECRLTENEIFLALKQSSSPALLNQLNLLQYVGHSFLVKMAQMARCNIKNDLYRRETRMNTNFLLFYASMRSVFLCLQGRSNVEQIRTYYKLISYRECRVKALLYITVILFQCIRNRQEGVKPNLFMWTMNFVSRKLRSIKQGKSFFLSNLKYLLMQIVCDVYVRLFIFIQKCRSIHVVSRNGKNGFRRVLSDSYRLCIRGMKDAEKAALYQMGEYSNEEGTHKEVLQMGGSNDPDGGANKLGLVERPVSATQQGKILRRRVGPMLPSTRVTTERIMVSHLIGKVKRISSLGVQTKGTSKQSGARRRGRSIFNFVVMVERYLRRKERRGRQAVGRSATKRVLPLGDLQSEGALFERDDLKRGDLKRGDLNRARFNRARFNRARFNRAHFNRAHFNRAHFNRAHFNRAHFKRADFKTADFKTVDFKTADFGRHFLELMCSDPQEYLYRNVADGRNNHLNMFIFFIYKKQVSKNSLQNLLHYLELNTLFKSLYMGQPIRSSRTRGGDTLQERSLTPFFEMMLFYYEKYRWNEVNRYLLPNSYGVDLFSLYSFLDMCVSCSNTVESGTALLRFVRGRIRRGGALSGKTRREGDGKARGEGNGKTRREGDGKARGEGNGKTRREGDGKTRREGDGKTRGDAPPPAARLAHFLLCFVDRLHVLISIKSRPSWGERNRENHNGPNEHVSKKQRTGRTPLRKTPQRVKPVLLNKYLLLKCNSLKVQSKLIEKYFVDLYKRKHFLKDMFLRFNNLKRKKNT
ncbi:hypothetical protein PCYB_031920 [Plasmodium cynomolgi strain B]|uniref:Uncharacterized protein n=1 Tax=Plasmodium cynomolgi (strain B) TaxID=1120755 RepID=K6UPX1_PLACD|nr:hypothetical protein PCYB_031920 [Plasmodium cynomolgi strain B]GAB64779.1 hypothetical protein PCYB_031920 [Plasmodium cynomolgi strain B]